MQMKEVALKLGVSIHTVIAHGRNAYQKLEVHDRGDLVRHLAPPNVDAVRDTLSAEVLEQLDLVKCE